MTNALPLTCPVCGEKTNRPPRLIPDGKTLRCPKGHSFDVSAKGYVNLLLTQHKNVKDPGDSKEMAAARRLFLDSGAYSGLRDALCGCAAKYAAEFPKPVTMVDSPESRPVSMTGVWQKWQRVEAVRLLQMTPAPQFGQV